MWLCRIIFCLQQLWWFCKGNISLFVIDVNLVHVVVHVFTFVHFNPQLYLSENFGYTWRAIQYGVKSFYWYVVLDVIACYFTVLNSLLSKYLCNWLHGERSSILRYPLYNEFSVHLSRRLKCTIVIMRCPSSVRPLSAIINFSPSPLNPLNGIRQIWQEARSQCLLPSFCFFGPIRKLRWPPWPLIDWDIFDFSSETTERNSTKLDRKQDLNILYQVCVFLADQKNKMAALASDWLRHFRLFLWNPWTEFNETRQEASSQLPLQSLCFSCRSENKMAALASDWLRHFRLL